MSATFKKVRGITIAVTGLLFIGMVFLQTYGHTEQAPQVKAPTGEDSLIESVDPEVVCMVNDSIMGKQQIPVQVEGKTYYGCCAGCVEALKNDRSVRFTKDPVTGNEVDKAASFIMPGTGGKALYFESLETAQKYSTSTKK